MKDKWIRVKDRMPEERLVIEGKTGSDLVLVCVKDYRNKDKFVCDDVTVNGEWANFSTDDYEVTHWMPFPDPPKED